jgi:hypothetical protein
MTLYYNYNYLFTKDLKIYIFLHASIKKNSVTRIKLQKSLINIFLCWVAAAVRILHLFVRFRVYKLVHAPRIEVNLSYLRISKLRRSMQKNEKLI